MSRQWMAHGVDGTVHGAGTLCEGASVPASPWGTVEGTMGKIGMVTVVYGAAAEGSDSHPPVVHDIGMGMGPASAYVASWHPDVALRVADLLDVLAECIEDEYETPTFIRSRTPRRRPHLPRA